MKTYRFATNLVPSKDGLGDEFSEHEFVLKTDYLLLENSHRAAVEAMSAACEARAAWKATADASTLLINEQRALIKRLERRTNYHENCPTCRCGETSQDTRDDD